MQQKKQHQQLQSQKNINNGSNHHQHLTNGTAPTASASNNSTNKLNKQQMKTEQLFGNSENPNMRNNGNAHVNANRDSNFGTKSFAQLNDENSVEIKESIKSYQQRQQQQQQQQQQQTKINTDSSYRDFNTSYATTLTDDRLQQQKGRSGKQYNNNNNPHNNTTNSNNTKHHRNISTISQDNQIYRNENQQQNLDGGASTSSSFSASSSTTLSAASTKKSTSLAKINGVALPCAKCSMEKADNHILKSTTGPVTGSNTIPPSTQNTSIASASCKVFGPMNASDKQTRKIVSCAGSSSNTVNGGGDGNNSNNHNYHNSKNTNDMPNNNNNNNNDNQNPNSYDRNFALRNFVHLRGGTEKSPPAASSGSSVASTSDRGSSEKVGHRWAALSLEQVRKLDNVMNKTVAIQGRGGFPTLEVTLKDLVISIRRKLESDISSGGAGVKVKDLRLIGGAASHVLALEDQRYNDVDFIYSVELESPRGFDHVKAAVLNTLLDLFPEGVSKGRITPYALKEAYVGKMVKVTNENDDRWSLITLGQSSTNENVDLKFVDTMRRQFEFSVDSFQIILDSLLLFYGCAAYPISGSFYPRVVGESVYGDFQQALFHLQNKLISTRQPEDIRGGGLLKYCNLLARNYKAADPHRIRTLERSMCSRFFIDFPDVTAQTVKFEAYLRDHFWSVNEQPMRFRFLMHLHKVVEQSTVCLMIDKRRITLHSIYSLATKVRQQAQQQQEQQQQAHQRQQHQQLHQHPATALAATSRAILGAQPQSSQLRHQRQHH